MAEFKRAIAAGSGAGGYGNLTLTTLNGGVGDTSGDALTLDAPITAYSLGGNGGTVSLVSAGPITQAATGAGIIAAALTGSSAGSTTLTGTGNQIADLGAFTAAGAGANFAITFKGALPNGD